MSDQHESDPTPELTSPSRAPSAACSPRPATTEPMPGRRRRPARPRARRPRRATRRADAARARSSTSPPRRRRNAAALAGRRGRRGRRRRRHQPGASRRTAVGDARRRRGDRAASDGRRGRLRRTRADAVPERQRVRGGSARRPPPAQRAVVRIRSAHFGPDVRRARTTDLQEQPPGLVACASADGCLTVDPGPGSLSPATYDGAPAYLVLRPPAGRHPGRRPLPVRRHRPTPVDHAHRAVAGAPPEPASPWGAGTECRTARRPVRVAAWSRRG